MGEIPAVSGNDRRAGLARGDGAQVRNIIGCRREKTKLTAVIGRTGEGREGGVRGGS